MNKLLLLPLPLLLVACRPVGPTYTPPRPTVPEQFTSTGGTAAAASEWGSIWKDSQLQMLVKRAFIESPDLKAAEARLRQARASQGIQEAAGGPDIGMGAKVSRDKMSENSGLISNLPVKNLKTEFTTYQVGFDASWEIDLFGHQRRMAEGARARTQASEERLRDVRLVLASEVTRNYVEYRMGQQRFVLTEESVKHYEELVRLTKLRVSAGDAASQDQQRAETNRNQAQAALAGLSVNVHQSLAALSVLTATQLPELDAQLRETAPLMPVPAAPATGLPSELLQRRPDVRAAEREMAAACADVGVAQAERYPRFAILGSGGWTSISSETLISSASSAWSVGPQLSLPLFNRGKLKNKVRANEAAYDAATATYRKSVLTAVADTEVALTRVAKSEDRRLRLEDSERLSRESVKLAELQVKAGEISKMSLLEARLNHANQEDQKIQAHAQSLTALVSLQKALGGAWQ
ncbi:efflux transporter outer membrane subunit [Holophaga foetida]|uniref:efflux transporter outer membrane subunit n=1 Tax=Holophaga foetida TaxID=35839 RepID=UPI0002473F35|nr:efflux transporter outer membrane subunit [Holophaga foetida]